MLNIETKNIGIQSKLDYDQVILAAMMKKVHATNQDEKVKAVDELEELLADWIDTQYESEIATVEDMHGIVIQERRQFDAQKRTYCHVKSKALTRLMGRLTIIGKINVMPQATQQTRVTLPDANDTTASQ